MVDVAYTDKNRVPTGSLSNYKIDLDIGNDNDFEIQMNLKNHVMDYESIWYVDGTEYGGMIDYIKLSANINIGRVVFLQAGTVLTPQLKKSSASGAASTTGSSYMEVVHIY